MAHTDINTKMDAIAKILDKHGYSYTRYNKNHSFRVLDPYTGYTFKALMPLQDTDGIMMSGQILSLEELETQLVDYLQCVPIMERIY